MADQMKRSSTSVGLNAGEGLYARGGNRTSRLETAMNSGRETILALRMSGRCQYLPEDVAASEVREIDRIVAVLYKLQNR